jgi:hypothetical protein
MFTYIDTIQNLPVAQKRSLLKSIKEMIKDDIIANRQANFERKQNSALLRATKKAERIAKLEAKTKCSPQSSRYQSYQGR